MASYAVYGRGEFPIDMLRYAQAWPASAEDANRIVETMRSSSDRRWRVHLYSVSSDVLHAHETRWESFGCRVVDEDSPRFWESPAPNVAA